MVKFQWEWNDGKKRWEIIYYGRKIRKPIFECMGDITKTESYSPITDYPQSSLCGGAGKALLDGKPVLSHSVWRNMIIQVICPENTPNIFWPIDALDVRIIITRFDKNWKAKQEVIYIGLPPKK